MRFQFRSHKFRLKVLSVLLALILFLFLRRIIALSSGPEFGGLVAKDCIIDSAETQELNQGGENVAEGNFLEQLPLKQRGGTLNDASCINRTAVRGIVQVGSVKDLQKALAVARDNNLHISIAGVRHSMGGQAFASGALILDMLQFSRIQLNEEKKTITVQSGATWHDIQKILHPRYAVLAMQSSDIFSVGGSISVNAHGMDQRAGSLGKSLVGMRVLLSDGRIVHTSREENSELFHLVVGGYGLFGIIIDAELAITDNAIYQSERELIAYDKFPDLYEQSLAQDPKLGLMYAHLSTSPSSLLREAIVYKYRELEAINESNEDQVPPLEEVGSVRLKRFMLNVAKLGSWTMKLRWYIEKNIEPKLESCTIERNTAQASGEACLVSRNDPMHDSVPYLKDYNTKSTDILQEYYVPQEQFVKFIDELRELIISHNAKLLNASVRIVHKEDNVLSYASRDKMFAVVLYFNQKVSSMANSKMKHLTQDIIDLSHRVGGTFFLPYQLHYSDDQLKNAYPNIDEFFAMKREYDPAELLVNKFYLQYGRSSVRSL